MKPKNDELGLAVWRYGIISPLLHRHPDQLGKGQVLADMGRRSYVRENGQRVTLSPETIRKWLTRYRQGGLPALADKPRHDKGKHHIDQAIIDAMVALRDEHPRWTLTRMFEHMLEKGIRNGRRPSQAT